MNESIVSINKEIKLTIYPQSESLPLKYSNIRIKYEVLRYFPIMLLANEGLVESDKVG
jgi:hypothetical protein